MMNAAVPDGTPPRRISSKQTLTELTDPPCLGEALRRATVINPINYRKYSLITAPQGTSFYPQAFTDMDKTPKGNTLL